jgi:starch synthase
VEPESYAGLVAGFAEAMRKLLGSPGLAKTLGVAGRERAIRDFDWQRKVDEMIGIYRSVTENLDVPHKLEITSISNATASETN